ncbi:MAG: carbohydrate kinase family protein [Anaerolineae bacterium]
MPPSHNALDLLAVGELIVDFISTEAHPQLEDAAVFQRYLGGAPVNVAVTVANLGGDAAVVSKIGPGPMGRFLRRELRRHGVRVDYLVEDPVIPSTLSLIARTTGTPDFQIIRGADANLERTDIPPAAMQAARAVHTSAFALSREPCQSAVRAVLRDAHAAGKLVSFDANYRPVVGPEPGEALEVFGDIGPLVRLMKASLDDAESLFSHGASPETYVNRFHDLGVETVVLTMGGEGVLLSDDEGVQRLPIREVPVADVTGAGDAFWGGFLVACLDGHPPERCLRFARLVAERKLASAGPLSESLPRAELYQHLES